MSKTKFKIQFAKLEIKMGHSEAYLSLGNPAMKILTFILFYQRWKDVSRHNEKAKWICTNNDKFQLLYSKLQSGPFRMHSKSITRGIDELLSKGFIKIIEQGGKQKGHASFFKMVDDYATWKKGDVSVRRPFRKRGFCSDSTGIL